MRCTSSYFYDDSRITNYRYCYLNIDVCAIIHDKLEAARLVLDRGAKLSNGNHLRTSE